MAAITTDDGERYCGDCATQAEHDCACGCVVSHLEHDRCPECNAVVEDRFNRSRSRRVAPPPGPIVGYHEAAPWTFIGEPDRHGGGFAGVELEVEAPGNTNLPEAAIAVKAAAGAFLNTIQRDGSLTYGFELVSQPHSLDAWKAAPVEAVCEVLREKKFTAHNTSTAGMHVHFSKVGLTPGTLLRMTCFLHATPAKMRHFCRRSSSSYAMQRNLIGKKIETVTYPIERYDILNLTNRKTVEFRGPRGSITPGTIRATIEFLYALVSHCRGAASAARMVEENGMWREFLQTVSRDRKLYPNLVKYLDARGLWA